MWKHLFLLPNIVHIDFEIAIHSAVKMIWPTTMIKGCRFRLDQAWWHMIQNVGLFKLYKNENSEIGKFLKYKFGLPF